MTTNTPVETVSSASPSVKLGPAKAIVSGILGALGLAIPVAVAAVADGSLDLTEGWNILGALLAGGGIIGGGTWLTPTSVSQR